MSGCSIQKVDNNDYVSLMNKVLSFNIKNRNMVSNGYDYYLPKGVTRIESSSYNDVLKRNNNLYYLYADIVSYYYKENIESDKSKNAYYYNEINNDNKKGYVLIEKTNNEKKEFYVQMFYNYAKIEAYTSKRDLTQTVTDLSYILSSIKFNDTVLAKAYSIDNQKFKDETYKLFKDKEKTGNFLEYIKEYDKYDDSKSENDGEVELKLEQKSGSNNN